MERTESLWLSTSDAPSYPRLSGDIKVDAVVIGGGISGLCAAYQLEQNGLSVAVLEANRVCAGVTGYTTAKVTSGHGLIYAKLNKNAGQKYAHAYADANQWAVRWIESLGIDCDLKLTDMQVFADTEEQLSSVQEELEITRELGLPVSWSTGPDLPFLTHGAVRYDNQVQFHPRKFVAGLAARLTGQIFEQTVVTDVEDADPCRVTTESGVVTARFVVVASHFPCYDPAKYYLRLAPYRDYAIAAKVRSGMPSGMSIGASESGKAFRAQGDWLIVSGEMHKVGQEPDTEQRFRSLEQYVRQHFEVESVDYGWSTQDIMTPDSMPYIGWIDTGSERVLVSTGFGGWGMSTGAYAGKIIADLVAGRDNAWAPCFTENRLKGFEGLRTLASEGFNVAKHLIGDKITDTSDKAAIEIKPGEAAIIKANDEKVAAYRDPEGVLHALSPACTHMGCDVAWNSAELSWDCPCHGSRFNIHGQVIQGPAIKDLEKKAIEAERGPKLM